MGYWGEILLPRVRVGRPWHRLPREAVGEDAFVHHLVEFRERFQARRSPNIGGWESRNLP